MKTLQHKFVEFIPEDLEDAIIYITIHYRTAVHNCVCGCGNRVVTPISPTDWKLTFNGKSISLHPSIGNWGFECRSHYWIKNNEIIHAPKWDDVKEKPERTIIKKRRKWFSFKKNKRK